MFTVRPCGCKGQRSCLICEGEFGPKNEKRNELPVNSYVFCPKCESAWPGWDINDCMASHSKHVGNSTTFPGVKIILDFVSEDEEKLLLKNIEEVPWDLSQSGRRKQNYGPKCNFKKRKVKLDGFEGYPGFTHFIQERFKKVDVLSSFQTVEQCSLEYTTERGSSIDPHIDDCWIWGERIPTLSLLSDSVLTLTTFEGSNQRYNLNLVSTYPNVVNENGSVKSEVEIMNKFNSLSKDVKEISTENLTAMEAGLKLLQLNSMKSTQNDEDKIESVSNSTNLPCDPIITHMRVPMPRRSLLILYGPPRYDWEHAVLREDILDRRVCLTYRELTPTFGPYGKDYEIGQQIVEKSLLFWDHSEKYLK